MKIRGSGEIFGFKQHGENELVFSNLSQDIHIFKLANLEAKRFLESKESKDEKITKEIMDKLQKTFKVISFN